LRYSILELLFLVSLYSILKKRKHPPASQLNGIDLQVLEFKTQSPPGSLSSQGATFAALSSIQTLPPGTGRSSIPPVHRRRALRARHRLAHSWMNPPKARFLGRRKGWFFSRCIGM